MAYIYFLTFEGKEINHITFDAINSDAIIDLAEDYIWNHRDDNTDEIDRIFVISFRDLYSFEAKVSGSFVDTYWQIFDEPHYNVWNVASTKFKYREKEYAKRYKSLLTLAINNKYNLEELRRYFLRDGYCYLLDWKDEDTHDVYELIDIDIERIIMTASNKFCIMSADYNSILDYEDGHIYLRGKIEEEYPTINKILQVGDLPCQYIHSIKTSRVLYEGKLYESTGKTLSIELNKLNKLLDNKILCCYFCKYGNQLDDEKKIYCLNGFTPKNFNDVLFDINKPFVVILGGKKVEDKIGLINNLIKKVDKFIITGAMSFTFLKAQGFNVGKSIVDESNIKYAKRLLKKYKDKIILIEDCIVSNDSQSIKELRNINEIKDNEIGFDVGPKTIKMYKDILKDTNTIFFNGPLGLFENKEYETGTKDIINYLKTLNSNIIIGGGDTINAAKKYGLKNAYLSTGGGATLEYLEKGKLKF